MEVVMKKFFVLIAALFVLASVPTFAAGPAGLTGLGVYGSVGTTNGALGGGVGLSLKWGSFPVVGLQYDFAADRFGGSVDYYVIDADGIASHISYFLGAGLYAGIASGDFDFGLRIPVGLQFWPVRKLELYISPVLSIPLIPTPDVGIGAEFGARIHF
jgi:hypothetical protein